MALRASHEDYLRAIWKLNEWQDHPVTSSELAKTLKLSPSTVSEGVGKLVDLGFIRHAPYGAISLTEKGRAEAARMVRIHRLLETGLVKIFGYSWDEVHAEAEHLEHAVSDLFIERLDSALGHPKRDPHGDVIPDPELRECEPVTETRILSSLEPGFTGYIDRVSDTDSEVLVYLEGEGLIPGTNIAVTGVVRSVGLLELDVDGSCLRIPLTAARAVIVSPADK